MTAMAGEVTRLVLDNFRELTLGTYFDCLGLGP